MANTDSFINEVTEEVRRDRLFALFRRWGWVAVLVVLGLVGGAAYIEWQAAQDRARAQGFGDALLAALDSADAEARIAALAAIDAPNAEAQIILALLAAGQASEAEDAAGAAARLRAAADLPGVDRRYVDLALLKAEMMDPGPEDQSRTILEAIAAPGAPYAALAEEQLALLEVRAGNLDAALDRLRAIERSAAATSGLQQRAAQLIVALESGSVLLDTMPVPPVQEEVPVAVPLGTGAGAEAEAPDDGTPAAADPAPADEDATAEDETPAVQQ